MNRKAIVGIGVTKVLSAILVCLVIATTLFPTNESEAASAIVDATVVEQETAVGPWSHSHTMPSCSSDCVAVIAIYTGAESSGETIDSVSFGGTAATELFEEQPFNEGDPGLAVYWMPDADLPAAGSQTLSVGFSSTAVGASVVFIYDGASQTQPTNIDSANLPNDNNAEITESLTGVSADSTVIAFLNDEGTGSATVTTGSGLINIQGCGGETGDCVGSQNTGSGTVSVVWGSTTSSGDWEKITGIVEVEAVQEPDPVKTLNINNGTLKINNGTLIVVTN